MTRPLMLALLYATLAAFATPAAAQGVGAATPAEVTALREGDMRKLVVHDAPKDVAEIAFTTPDGADVTLADSAGKIRILNFWATWCAPCRKEKPTLDTLNRDLSGPDFEVIALATGRNSPAGIKRFNDEVGVKTLTTYLDPKSEAARALGVLGLPVSVILDREGREIARLTGGADWASESARAIMAALIGAGS